MAACECGTSFHSRGRRSNPRPTPCPLGAVGLSNARTVESSGRLWHTQGHRAAPSRARWRAAAVGGAEVSSLVVGLSCWGSSSDSQREKHTQTHLHTRAHTAPHVVVCPPGSLDIKVCDEVPAVQPGWGSTAGGGLVLNQHCRQNQGHRQTVTTKPCWLRERHHEEEAGERKRGAPRVSEAGKRA